METLRPLTLGISGNSQSIGMMLNDISTGEMLWHKPITYVDGLSAEFGIRDFFVGDGAGGWFWSPAMTAKGLELMLAKLSGEVGPDTMKRIVAISGGFHQHARFDTNDLAPEVLSSLDGELSVQASLNMMLANGPFYPCWMHAGALNEARSIASTVGSNARVAKLTGSAATPRFPLAPLKYFADHSPAQFWAKNTRFHSGSSLIPSLLCGEMVGLDASEASAWNLMNLANGKWSRTMASVIGRKLLRKLPKIIPSLSHVGNVSRHYQQTFGFAPDCRVYSFTGDNIASLLGNGVIKPGRVVVSLGTSWTVLDVIRDPSYDPSLLGSVMKAWTPDAFMRMTCQTNGGEALKRFRTELDLGNDWEKFDALLQAGDIDPDRVVTPFVFDESLGNRKGLVTYHNTDGADAKSVVPKVVHGLLANLVLGTRGFFGDLSGRTIIATGGGSQSPAILQAVADVFGSTVIPSKCSDTVALGGSLGAAIGWSRDTAESPDSMEDVVNRFRQHGEAVEPRQGSKELRTRLLETFQSKLR